MLHLQSPQFLPLPLPLPTSCRLRRSSLLCHGAGYSLRKLPESCYSYGSPVLRRSERIVAFVGKEETEVRVPASAEEEDGGGDEVAGAKDGDPQDLEYVRQIQRVLELLKKNRDMIFSEVRLTIMIEDAREVERRKLLGIVDPDAPTRDDLVVALEQVNEGKIPENRIALRMLAEEMNQWPNLEVETTNKKPSKSLYAKATDTGVDPKTAAKRLNIDWDTAAEIEDEGISQETEVPPAVRLCFDPMTEFKRTWFQIPIKEASNMSGLDYIETALLALQGYGALYLVTAFPVIIGISVVLILFYNSLQ